MNGASPEFVILSYPSYKRLEIGGESRESREDEASNPGEERVIEKLNKEILALKEEIRQKEEAELGGVSSEEITKVGEAGGVLDAEGVEETG